MEREERAHCMAHQEMQRDSKELNERLHALELRLTERIAENRMQIQINNIRLVFISSLIGGLFACASEYVKDYVLEGHINAVERDHRNSVKD